MGVFNGDSIYNNGNGGGGGGYADGGNLTPANYIEIENNSFYKLEGNDAADLNFVIDGESGVLNSIVEISTNIDSSVNVYVEKNGLLYALTSVDNLIFQNKSYRIYITGDSFNIDEIPNINLSISKASVYGNYIDVFEFGNYLISQDLGWFNYQEIIDYINGLSSFGWTLLSFDALNYVKNIMGIDAIRSSSGWTNTQGSNTSGLNIYPYGHKEYGYTVGEGFRNDTWGTGSGNSNFLYTGEINIGESTILTDSEIYCRGRIMKII